MRISAHTDVSLFTIINIPKEEKEENLLKKKKEEEGNEFSFFQNKSILINVFNFPNI